MTPREFVARLVRQGDRGITDTDFSIWFDRHRSNVPSWTKHGHIPREGCTFDELVRRLLLMEASPAFPVPYSVRQRARRAYIIEAFKNADNRGVSSGDPAVDGLDLPREDQGVKHSSVLFSGVVWTNGSNIGKLDE